MRILLLSPLPPPVGGIASWTINLLNYLSNNPEEFIVDHQNTAVKYRRITKNDRFSRILSGVKETKRIISDFRENIKLYKPDVIHLTSSASLGLLKDSLIINIAKKNKIPVITHWRFGRIPELAKKNNMEWRLLLFLVRQSKYSIVIDKDSYKTLTNIGLSNVLNIPNPVPIDLEQRVFSFSKTKERQPSRLVFVGHITKNKGVFELVESCTRLPIVLELQLIGPYEEKTKKNLISIATNKNNGHWLILEGPLNKESVLEKMQNSSILLLPSYSEGFPNVVVEAMSMGCAVIATDVGAIPEILNISSDKPCGICVPVHNVKKLSEAINDLVRIPSKAEAMGKNGIERVLNNYTLSIVVEQYKSVWRNSAE